MRKLFKNISQISLLLGFFLSMEIFAGSPVAVVTDLKGKAFYSLNGKTKEISIQDHIYDFGEIFTEVGSQITLTDYHDHKFHMAGSGHLQFLNRTIELKKGYIWLQSFNKGEEFAFQTANGVVKYKYGESIISFDAITGKTQILVVKGFFDLENSLNNYSKVTVRDGQFSFVSNDYNDGHPRSPTLIGFSSYKKVTALFDGIHPEVKGQSLSEKTLEKKSRSIAQENSVDILKSNLASEGEKSYRPSASQKTKMKGVVYLIEDKKSQTKKREDLLNFYNKKMHGLTKIKKKKFRPSYGKKSNVKVRVFGKKQYQRTPASSVAPKRIYRRKSYTRKPASVGKMIPQVKKNGTFHNGLLKEYKKQMRHSNEVNSLIDELKTFDQDYKKSY